MADIGEVAKQLMSGNVVLRAAPTAGDGSATSDVYKLVDDVDYSYNPPEDRIDYGQKRDYHYAQPDIELSFSVRGTSDFAAQLTGKGILGASTSRLGLFEYVFETTDVAASGRQKVTISVNGYMMSHSIRRSSSRQNDPVTIRCRIRVMETAIAKAAA